MQGGANEMPYVPCAVTIVVTLENNRVRIAVNFVSEAGNTPQRTQLETNVRIYVCMKRNPRMYDVRVQSLPREYETISPKEAPTHTERKGRIRVYDLSLCLIKTWSASFEGETAE